MTAAASVAEEAATAVAAGAADTGDAAAEAGPDAVSSAITPAVLNTPAALLPSMLPKLGPNESCRRLFVPSLAVGSLALPRLAERKKNRLPLLEEKSVFQLCLGDVAHIK